MRPLIFNCLQDALHAAQTANGPWGTPTARGVQSHLHGFIAVNGCPPRWFVAEDGTWHLVPLNGLPR